MSEAKQFFLIDASSYMYRAFYGMRPLTSPKGMPTHAIYGFLQMLLKVLKDRSPEYVCVVFDSAGPTFRHELFSEYKATRQRIPEDLVTQIPYIKDLVGLHGLAQLEREGFEADDLIATLAEKARDDQVSVVIVSGDKDLHQLVEDPLVSQWDAQRDRDFDEAEVARRMGVGPRQVLDLLALMGDSSDHIPGVPGVGQKTAVKLLDQWESLEQIYANVDELKGPAVRKKLRENKELAYLSKELVKLRSDVPVEYELEAYRPQQRDVEKLVAVYRELGFNSLLQNLEEAEGVVPEPADTGEGRATKRASHIVRSKKDFSALLAKLDDLDLVSVDLETTSRDPLLADIVGIAISFKDHEGYYIPVAHEGEGSEEQLDRKEVLAQLGTLMSRPSLRKTGQNLKYEWLVFERHGIAFEGIDFDTMLASYLLEPGRHSHALERIVASYLDEDMISYSDVTGKGKDQVGFARVEVTTAAQYACEDAEVVWRLTPILTKRLRQEELLDLLRALELPLVPVLARMERRGVLVDVDLLEELSIEFQKGLDQRADAIYQLAGREFNINSPKQLGKVLFEDLGLPVIKRTKTGPSTDMSVLETLAGDHSIVEEVLVYRSLAKLKGTYVDAFPKLVNPHTGRIHTSFNQTVAATGRLSSSDPNLQNIPIRTEEGRRIREAFVAPPGHLLLSADYSQIELRVLAHCSRDQNLLAAFQEDADIHRRTAAEMFGVAPHEVTPEMRRQAKAINFGIIYGMGAFGLARQLRTSNATAKAAIDRYFERYRGVKEFIDTSIEEATRTGECRTLLGRKRSIPELGSRNRTVRQQGERLAVNTTIQGTAADLIKQAMLDIDRVLLDEGMQTAMLLQVHDELVFEVPRDELDRVRDMVREKMEGVYPLAVPLKVDMGWGENWSEAH